ncbi:hypothetical protein WJX77_009472 [Trebouxia sp. C0004]
MRLFDAHCHLQDPRITHCLEDTLNATEVQGVQQFACNGTSEDDWPQVAQLAKRHHNIKPSFGLHPWFLQGRSDKWLDNLRKQLEEVPQAGLGECGLDTSKKVQTPIHEQEEVFKAQLELGKELQRPISVHCVSAFGKLHDMVQHHGPFPQGLILHSWIGPAEMVDALAKIKGVYFSLSGHLTRMSKKKYEPMVQKIPLERLLLETDAPDGRPRLGDPYQERLLNLQSQDGTEDQELNHPANIRVMLELLADIRRQEAEIIAEAAFSNANSLFSFSSQ